MSGEARASEHAAMAGGGAGAGLDRAALARAIETATRRIAPLWPLRHFVAVNPYLGLSELDFPTAARRLAAVTGARMTPPQAFFADALRSGRIGRRHLEAAMAEAPVVAGVSDGVAALEAFAAAATPEEEQGVRAPCVADVAREVTGEAWDRFVVQSISAWASSHFDEGQALWSSPWQSLPAWAAWQAEAAHDRGPEIAGIPGFRATIGGLPAQAEEAIAESLRRLGVDADGLDTYLHRLLVTIGGWAAWARYQVWECELYGGQSPALVELLAVRLAFEVALLEGLGDVGVARAWAERRHALVSAGSEAGFEPGLAARLTLQEAFEKSLQEDILGRISKPKPAALAEPARKSVQAVFCIDVRSEILRRALESQGDDVETLGFAGFFGFPIEYVPIAGEHGGAQCPVLLTPDYVITESLRDAGVGEEQAASRKRGLRRRAAHAWRSFKLAAVSCFGFVGPVGLVYLGKLVSDSLGRTRPVEHPAGFGLDEDVRARLAPRLEPGELDGRRTGLGAAERLAMAEAVLRAMSMTGDFARLVLLAGHGSTTVNNPHATALDCGACGGHTGEANARVAAAVLQDPAVRAGLVERGIAIPEDTIFLAGQHDTATDEVTIFDAGDVPASHAEDLARLRHRLAEAGRLARAERARLLGVAAAPDVDSAVTSRSRDWSQVRPEWGLAGCAAFVAAPRHRTRGVDLGGRSFLHSYEWRQDEGFGVLELIMTAPMVVASWISLQYYGSTVDNELFGSGNKVLHNVVGTLGVLEGNGGDLRVGLPWQSVHDGERYVHEPARLNVVIEAPIEAMNDVIAKHEAVRQLVDNRWLHLFAIDDEGVVAWRYVGNLQWKEVETGSLQAA